jgi:O-antigen ligase
VIVGLLILLTPLLVGGFEAILYALGRDPDLTGRVDLWQALWSMIMNRPLFGYGYSAFWIGSNAPAAEIRNDLGWSVGHSHNVWLQVWLDMGFIGMFLLGLAFISATRAIFWNLRRFDSNGPQIQAMVLFALFVMNLVESDLLKQPSFQWALYICATAGSLQLRRHIEGRDSQRTRGLAHGIG